ncbi:MAG: Na+/H+ antiporter NhaC family protein [Bacteroidales bacterium]
MQNLTNSKRSVPRLWVALIPILFLIIALSTNIYIFGSDAGSGSTQIILMIASIFCFAVAFLETGTSWDKTEKYMVKHIGDSTPAIIILFLIGALSGTWMLSGVVPSMIYYGLQIINPTTFLLTACVISSIVSLSAGSSWATVATIGVAMMGVGKALGYSEGWIAGAVISGAYFGDKISPLSETTNLAANCTQTPLFKHIKNMMITTVPSYVITLILFIVAGLVIKTDGNVELTTFTNSLAGTYNISPWLLLIPAFTFILILKKVPTALIMIISSLVAAVVAAFYQTSLTESITGITDNPLSAGLTAAFQSMYGSISVETGNPSLNDLVATNGMAGMLNTTWLIIASMMFGGAMEAGGMLQTITGHMVKFMKNTFSTVGCTTFSCLFLNTTASDQYIAILLPGKMFSYFYKKNGYDSSLLSRTLEDSATVTSVLIPWNTCGMAQSTVLSVPTLTYLPYCFFNLLSPVMTLLVAAIGYKIKTMVTSDDFEEETDIDVEPQVHEII